MEVLTNTEVVALEGDSILQAITLQNRLSAEKKTFPTRCLFASEGFRIRIGRCKQVYSETKPAISLLAPICRSTGSLRTNGRSTAARITWRRTYRDCSLRETFVTARSNDVPQRWAKARWRSPSFTAILRPDDAIHG